MEGEQLLNGQLGMWLFAIRATGTVIGQSLAILLARGGSPVLVTCRSDGRTLHNRRFNLSR